MFCTDPCFFKHGGEDVMLLLMKLDNIKYGDGELVFVHTNVSDIAPN